MDLLLISVRATTAPSREITIDPPSRHQPNITIFYVPQSKFNKI